MTPTAGALLDKAHRSLNNARAIAAISIPEVAAREAYLAAFHAVRTFCIACDLLSVTECPKVRVARGEILNQRLEHL